MRNNHELTDDLETVLASLRRDYSQLSPRIREQSHSVTCSCGRVSLHLHYPSLRNGIPTVQELVDALVHFIIPFCLPRSEAQKVKELYGQISVDEFLFKSSELNQRALNLFKRAQRATNRNGEAGELLLFILTEWILDAPQIIAKMSLKTNSQMPVHGADGVHVRYCSATSQLMLYWGESKLYGDIGAAISEAAKSIAESLTDEKLSHEIDLIRRNIDFSGLEGAAKAEMLRYLDPYDESYNGRSDVITCLIGFNFDGYSQIDLSKGDTEETLASYAEAKLAEIEPTLTAALSKKGLEDKSIELFFLPVPSVQDFRDRFQSKIGWNIA